MVRHAFTQPRAMVRLPLAHPCATAHQPQLTNHSSATVSKRQKNKRQKAVVLKRFAEGKQQ